MDENIKIPITITDKINQSDDFTPEEKASIISAIRHRHAQRPKVLCPTCNEPLDLIIEQRCCDYCGQLLDWGY